MTTERRFNVVTQVEATLTEQWVVTAPDEEAARALFAKGWPDETVEYAGQEEIDHSETRYVVSVSPRKARR